MLAFYAVFIFLVGVSEESQALQPCASLVSGIVNGGSPEWSGAASMAEVQQRFSDASQLLVSNEFANSGLDVFSLGFSNISGAQCIVGCSRRGLAVTPLFIRYRAHLETWLQSPRYSGLHTLNFATSRLRDAKAGKMSHQDALALYTWMYFVGLRRADVRQGFESWVTRALNDMTMNLRDARWPQFKQFEFADLSIRYLVASTLSNDADTGTMSSSIVKLMSLYLSAMQSANIASDSVPQSRELFAIASMTSGPVSSTEFNYAERTRLIKDLTIAAGSSGDVVRWLSVFDMIRR